MTPTTALLKHLRELPDIAIAVSGGVDSMTLAVLAGRSRRSPTHMFHAISPAVPPEATERVRRYAEDEKWDITVLDAGEFTDPAYLANPAERCLHCKTHLYQAITMHTNATVLSGTNRDDLTDFRPGLAAAERFGVRHPYVELDIGKADIRCIAGELSLADVAELPAAPCLSSRVETGLPINAHELFIVNQVERRITTLLQPKSVRCRVRPQLIVIELDNATLNRLDDTQRAEVLAFAENAWHDDAEKRKVELAQYRQGSAWTR